MRHVFPFLLLVAWLGFDAQAQCTVNSTKYNMSYTLDDAGSGTFPYSLDVTNNENGNGNRIDSVYIEIGPTATVLIASATAPLPSSTIWASTSPDNSLGYRAIRFRYLSGYELKSGGIVMFAYELNEAYGGTSLRMQTRQRNGQTDDITFDASNCADLFGAIPVELVSFTGHADGTMARLRWETATEQNNAGFEVQHRRISEADFRPVSFVAGHGTSQVLQSYQHTVSGLAPGRHVFRLRQIDFDGTVSFSPEIEMSVALPGPLLLSDVYPNPVASTARFDLGTETPQHVVVELLDVTGRRVATLHDGALDAGSSRTFTLDGTAHPSGLYLLRVRSERATTTRPVVIVR